MEHLIQTFTILTTLHSFLLANLYFPTFIPTLAFLRSCNPTLHLPPYIPSFLQTYTSLTTLYSFLQSHTFLPSKLHYPNSPAFLPTEPCLHSCKPTQTLPSLPLIPSYRDIYIFLKTLHFFLLANLHYRQYHTCLPTEPYLPSFKATLP